MKTDTIRQLVLRHAPTDGLHETPLDGVQLFRLTQPMERLPAVFSPSVCVVVQGSKRAYLGDAPQVYEPGKYLCATMVMPVLAEAPLASPEEPLLGIYVSLETRVFTETVMEFETASEPLPADPSFEAVPGLSVATWDEAFSSALTRMLELLGDPLSLRMLGRGRLRELFFAILRGDVGASVRRVFGAPDGLLRALTHLRENLSQPISVDDLAREAGMSRAVFDRRFREATTFSALQFIKKLRLNEAALQLASGMSVAHAAASVGYVSSSQFSRDFRRLYGESPRDWRKAILATATGSQLSVL